jgi:hypothetical protein
VFFFLPSNLEALSVKSAKVKLNTKKGDLVKAKGSYDALTFEGDSVTVKIGPLTQTIPVSEFKDKGTKLKFKAAKGETGVIKLLLNKKKQTFNVKVLGDLTGITNPLDFQLMDNTTDECSMALLTERKPGLLYKFKDKKNTQSPCEGAEVLLDSPDDPGAPIKGVFVNELTEIRIQTQILSSTVDKIELFNITTLKATTVEEPVPVCELFDNGLFLTSGDDIADDSVYSCLFYVSETTPGSVQFYLKTTEGESSSMSSSFSISVLEPLTTDEMDTVVKGQADASQIWAEKLASMGDTPEAREAAVNEIKQLSGVKNASVSDDGLSIVFEYDSGVKGGLMLNPAGTRGSVIPIGVRMSRSEKPAVTLEPYSFSTPKQKAVKADDDIDIENNNVLIWDAYNSDFAPFDEGPGLRDLYQDSKCPKFSVAYLVDGACTVNSVNNFADYGTIILVTHGAVDGDGDVVFLTRETASLDTIVDHMLDILIGDVIVMGDVFAIKPSFITNLSSSFQNSVVYNGSCQSSANNTMANAFTGKGAKTYYGFTKVVNSDFAQNVATQLFTNLVTKLDNTGDSFTPVTPKTDPTAPNAVFTQSGSEKLAYSVELKNGDFEKGNLNSWTQAGDGRVISVLGEWSPTEGSFMGIISTGLGFTDSSGSIEQNFCLAKEATNLTFDWNFNSEEFEEYCNSAFDDRFVVELVTDAGTQTLFESSVNLICNGIGMSPTGLYFDQSFPGCEPSDGVGFGTGGNDCLVWSTGWQSQDVDISAIATANDGAGVTLRLSSTDVGDSIYDSAILLDKITIVKP